MLVYRSATVFSTESMVFSNLSKFHPHIRSPAFVVSLVLGWMMEINPPMPYDGTTYHHYIRKQGLIKDVFSEQVWVPLDFHEMRIYLPTYWNECLVIEPIR